MAGRNIATRVLAVTRDYFRSGGRVTNQRSDFPANFNPFSGYLYGGKNSTYHALRAVTGLISSTIAQVDFYVAEKQRDNPMQEGVRADHPINFLLKYPSRYISREDLLIGFVNDMLISGSGYLYANRAGRERRPDALINATLNSKKSISPNATITDPAEYDIHLATESAKFYPNVVTRRNNLVRLHWDYNPHDGVSLSPVDDELRQVLGIADRTMSLQKAIYDGGPHVLAFLRNSVGVSSPEQEKQLGTALKKKSGVDNAATFLPLPGEREVVASGIEPILVNLPTLLGWADSQIYKLYRVPPVIMGEAAGTTTIGAGISEHRKRYMTDCIMPIVRKLETALTTVLLSPRDLTRGLYIRGDATHVGLVTLHDHLDMMTRAANTGAFRINEVRALGGLAPIEGGEVLTQQQNTASPRRDDAPGRGEE